MQKRSISWLVLSFISIASCILTGCDQREMLRKMTPQEDYVLARSFVSQLVSGNKEAALKALSSRLSEEEARSGLAKLEPLFKHGELKNAEVIGLSYHSGFGSEPEGRNTALNLQMELSSGWFVGTVLTVDESGTRKILSVRFEEIPDSLEKINALNFWSKSPLHWLFLLLVIAVPLYSLYALVLCFRTKMKRRWLWVLFVALGLMTLRINWSSGALSFQPLSFQLLGASFFRNGLMGPWVLGISFPVGAVLFLRKRKRMLAEAKAAETATPPPLPESL